MPDHNDGFLAALAFVLRPENDGQPLHYTPGDTGAWTAWGITRSSALTYFARHGMAGPTVTAMAEWRHDSPIVAAIYREDYWHAAGCEVLPAGADLFVFDDAVNCGPGTAVRRLQASVGAATDGQVGPMTATLAAFSNRALLIRDLHARRAAYYRALPGFAEFGRGWLRRTDDARDAALARAGIA